MPDLVGKHGLWTEEQVRAERRLAAEIESARVEMVRLLFADQHGILRGKAMVAREALAAMRGGVGVASTLLMKDSSHRTVFPVFSAGGAAGQPKLQGAADVLMIADPSTWRVLPWEKSTAWVLCDLHFRDGAPAPFDSRRIARNAAAAFEPFDCALAIGLEVEFHIFRTPERTIRLDQSGQPGAPPEFSLLSSGAQYLTELTYDSVSPVLELLRRNVLDLGLPLRSMEVEFGPSQFEFTFGVTGALAAADNMMMFRAAAKEVCRRNNLHATFMCRPKIANVASSGWHLHQSLLASDGRNLFMPESDGDFAPLARRYLAGLLEHGRGATLFAAPTINAYRRYRAYSLAPDRVSWGRDNRGVMIRYIGGAGDAATRLENRAGEPAANPYLYIASQAISGLDGVRRNLDPPAAADLPYESEAAELPRSLAEAVSALRADETLCRELGAEFVNYYCRIKEAELSRFAAEVTDWEHREYFDLF
ncbi:MAG TPA: glutamine synthetase family protein [Roseiarcus sp.]|nr:glutamine synthetase family protein [Roseiarcus sp.]